MISVINIFNNLLFFLGVFMIKNYKLALIGLLVSCCLSHAMESDESMALSKPELESKIKKMMEDFSCNDVSKVQKLLDKGKEKGIKLDDFLLKGCMQGIDEFCEVVDMLVGVGMDVTSYTENINKISLIGCSLVNSGMMDVKQEDFVKIKDIQLRCFKLKNITDKNSFQPMMRLYGAIRKKVEETS